MEVVEPVALEEAWRVLEDDPEGARPLAGGTALVLLMRQGFLEPDRLVSLRRLEELRGTRLEPDGGLWIGACETLSDLARSPVVRGHAPSLADACRVVGNVRVRNAATIGGNLAEADHASDPPPVLASLDAHVLIAGPHGGREVPVAGFATGYLETVLEEGELITGVVLPPPPAGSTRRASYTKFRTRSTEDRACVGVAARVDLDGQVVRDLAVVVGAVAATVQHLPDVTAAYVDRHLDASVAADIADAYADAIAPMDDARGSAWYRRRVMRVLVRRAVEELAGPGGPRA